MSNRKSLVISTNEEFEQERSDLLFDLLNARDKALD